MTPADEAYELIEKFYYVIPSISDEGQLEDEISKKCALITVNKLIKETGSKYWYNVKKEIENL